MKFFEMTQNNSGGKFDVTEVLCHTLIIEAESEKDALTKAEKFGVYFNGVKKGIDCPCCGERWIKEADEVENFTFNEEVFATIEEYCQALSDDDGCTVPDMRIFYANGKVTKIFSKNVE